MIQTQQITIRKQVPSTADGWLYEIVQLNGEESRNFVKSVYLGKDAKEWQECTDEEKISWEEQWVAEHHQSEAPEPIKESETAQWT